MLLKVRRVVLPPGSVTATSSPIQSTACETRLPRPSFSVRRSSSPSQVNALEFPFVQKGQPGPPTLGPLTAVGFPRLLKYRVVVLPSAFVTSVRFPVVYPIAYDRTFHHTASLV